MNMGKPKSMESFLRGEDLKLMMENMMLKDKLKCKEIVSDEELERAYVMYYDENNEVLKHEKSVFR